VAPPEACTAYLKENNGPHYQHKSGARVRFYQVSQGTWHYFFTQGLLIHSRFGNSQPRKFAQPTRTIPLPGNQSPQHRVAKKSKQAVLNIAAILL
jgi:hypothetical protein